MLVLHRCHRQVEQHRRDQDRLQGRHGADEPLRVAVRIRPRVVAGLSRREPGHRMERRKVDRERARVGVDGLSDRCHAAADGDGGQLRRQWRRTGRTARDPRRLSRQPPVRGQAESPAPHNQRRHRRGAHHDHGGSRHARHGETGADPRLYDRRERRAPPRSWSTAATRYSDNNASFVGFVPSRNPALAIIVVIDSPHGRNGTHGGSVAAPIWKRIAEPALQHLGVGPDADSTSAGSLSPVATKTWRLRTPSAGRRPADDQSGRGRTARDSARSGRPERARRDPEAREARD